MTNHVVEERYLEAERYAFELLALSAQDRIVILCLDGLCHHSPDAPSCRRDQECSNVFIPSEGSIYPMVVAEDYERCAFCGALIWWAWGDRFQSELLIEPHSKSCWHTRYDPGGYNYPSPETFIERYTNV